MALCQLTSQRFRNTRKKTLPREFSGGIQSAHHKAWITKQNLPPDKANILLTKFRNILTFRQVGFFAKHVFLLGPPALA